MSQLQDIISDIENERCILVIGPDLVDFDGQSYFEFLCQELSKSGEYDQLLDLTPQYIFPHEELLQLKPGAKDTRILNFIEKFLDKRTEYDEPFGKIAQIPFHVILSFFPDTRLKRVFENRQQKFEYASYPIRPTLQVLNKPTKKSPLIYNLLGDLSDNNIILTFDHLFDYLSRIMGAVQLPQALQEALNKARTFIFLGVHFERWYVQLLLRIITGDKRPEMYTILKNGTDNEVCTFIARRLALDLIDTEPVQFLNQLYDECAAKQLLKTKKKVFISYSHHDKEIASRIEAWLKENEIEVIIDEESMSGGEKIEMFIQTIHEVDAVVAIISRDSLMSKWVSKEIVATLQQSRAYFIPCYLDDSFSEQDFYSVAASKVDARLKEIAERIGKRGYANTDDLNAERKDWVDYIINLDGVLNELRARKCIPLNGDFKKAMEAILEAIK